MEETNMKKITALILSLVMALSLSVMAFAATDPAVYAVVGGEIKTDAAHTLNNVVSHKAITLSDGSGYLAYYTAGKAGEETYLLPCANKSDATHALYQNGSFDTWLVAVDGTKADDAQLGDRETIAAAAYDVVAKVQKATTAKPNCTTAQYKEDGYIDVDGNFFSGLAYDKYEPENENHVILSVNGTLVAAKDVTGDTDYVIAASHVFAQGVKNDKTGYDVATCLICKEEFACTNDEAVATKNGYKVSSTFSYSSDDASAVYEANKFNGDYDFAWGQKYASDYKYCWALKATTDKPADGNGTTVPSAKTFDAGIAVYAALALTSVTGTAIVIGKKKEF